MRYFQVNHNIFANNRELRVASYAYWFD